MAFNFNNIPPEIVDEVFHLIDSETMSIREVVVWLAKEHDISFTKTTVDRWYRKGRENIEYIPSTDPIVERINQKKAFAEAEKARKIETEKRHIEKKREERKVKDRATKKLQKIAKKKLANKITLQEEMEAARRNMPHVAEVIESIIWRPNPGPQTVFLSASETDVLFGGAAGGGKSVAMVVDPLRFAHRKAHRGLILRRTLKELRQLIDLSREYYPQAYSGAHFRETEKTWIFPSGAKIEFNYLEKEADVYQYQGQDYTWIGFDEITQLPSEWSWNYLASRLRTSDPEIETYLRCTANPGGVGHDWVKKRYIAPVDPGEAWIYQTNERDGTQLTRRFIPALLKDNPYLWEDGKYETMLKSLPEIERRRLLEGDWDVVEGAAFPEFDREFHLVDPFDPPVHWKRIRGVDYGYAAPSCCLWGAVDPEDGTVVIYRELYAKGLTGEALAEKIVEMERGDMPMGGVIDWSVFNRQGYKNTIGHVMNSPPYSLKLRPANKDRKAGKSQIHERLARRNGKLRPGLQITTNCVNLIKELTSLPLKDNDPEDVDTNVDDHAYDALRYLVMDLPRIPTVRDLLFDAKRRTIGQHKPVDEWFGY